MVVTDHGSFVLLNICEPLHIPQQASFNMAGSLLDTGHGKDSASLSGSAVKQNLPAIYVLAGSMQQRCSCLPWG